MNNCLREGFAFNGMVEKEGSSLTKNVSSLGSDPKQVYLEVSVPEIYRPSSK